MEKISPLNKYFILEEEKIFLTKRNIQSKEDFFQNISSENRKNIEQKNVIKEISVVKNYLISEELDKIFYSEELKYNSKNIIYLNL